MSVRKSASLKRAEASSKLWFTEWIEGVEEGNFLKCLVAYMLNTGCYILFLFLCGVGKLTEVLQFLTGSSIIPVNWMEQQIKCTFRHLEEGEKRWPSVRTCPLFAELEFPVFLTKEECVAVWMEAIAALPFGFTFV